MFRASSRFSQSLTSPGLLLGSGTAIPLAHRPRGVGVGEAGGFGVAVGDGGGKGTGVGIAVGVGSGVGVDVGVRVGSSVAVGDDAGERADV